MSFPSSVLSPPGAALGFLKIHAKLPKRSFCMPKMEPPTQNGVLSWTRVHTQKNEKNGEHDVVAPAAYEQSQSPLPHATAAERTPKPRGGNYFHPHVWEATDFVSPSATYSNANPTGEERLTELKKELKNMLSSAANKPFMQLELIDKIQQLGVGYHFEVEIEIILQQIYNDQKVHEEHHVGLYYESLRFRLLRQAGFYVSPEIFGKYKNEEGEFQENLVSDVQGMLSLYEATYLSMHGEDILDEAQAFTTTHLKSMVTCLPPPLALQVQRSLDIPLHHGVERVHARHYISIYQEDESRNEALLEFAKMDFNNLQLLHKKELAELLEWWKPVIADLKSKLPFQFRDRIAEAFVMNMGVNPEPHFSMGRIHQTKLWGVMTIIDDAHDLYCNIEELRPLCDALQRWDVENLDELTEHMKIIFHEVMNVMKEIEADMIRKRHFIGMLHLKKQVQIYSKSIFEEATMLHLKDPPKLETWIPLSTITIGYNFCLVNGVMNLGGLATEEVYDWIDRDPHEVVTTFCLISRLLDDIGTYKLEKERGQTVSTMFCYINEYGVSEEEAARGLQKMVKSLWKDLNKVFLRPTPVPMPVLKFILGLVRLIKEYTTYEDGYTETEGRTRKIIDSLIRYPIPN